jgi:hypothetical protein
MIAHPQSGSGLNASGRRRPTWPWGARPRRPGRRTQPPLHTDSDPEPHAHQRSHHRHQGHRKLATGNGTGTRAADGAQQSRPSPRARAAPRTGAGQAAGRVGRTLHGPALHHPRTHIMIFGTAAGGRPRHQGRQTVRVSDAHAPRRDDGDGSSQQARDSVRQLVTGGVAAFVGTGMPTRLYGFAGDESACAALAPR